MENSFLPEEQPELGSSFSKFKQIPKNILYAVGIGLFVFIFYFYFLSAPSDFQSGTIAKIESGMSLRGVSAMLAREHVIRSRIAFEAFAIIFGAEFHTQYADYYFEKALPVWEVARRVRQGENHMAPVALTIPEGFDDEQIADTASLQLMDFNKVRFLSLAKQGYLFPDTYFFLTNANENDVIKSMSDNFTKKVTPLFPEIKSSGKSEKDIITMASIVEREAEGDTDRGVISGILWRRVSIGMPLQVDVAPDTYKAKGLPKIPISNPGLEAIVATIHPTNSPYLYYLHDKNKNIHYAKTFAEHLKNIAKYLK